MIYIYSHTVTSRLEYTLEVLFKTILQVDFKIVERETFVENVVYPKINYSDEKIEDAIWIQPHSLLFETNISVQDIAVTHQKKTPYFFMTNEIADFKFDLFASSFYMLSRYEEYLPFKKDTHARFTAHESLAYKASFLQKPVVHLWAKQLRDAILKQQPNFLFPTRIFTQVNTIDIDIAYAFKGKSFIRQLGGFVKSIFTFNSSDLKNRISCFLGGKDPYDTYAIIKEIQEESKAELLYFFQVGKYGVYDKNLLPNKLMKSLITKVSEYAEIGIHPSYQSNEQLQLLKDEKKSLEKILDKPITKSRQHYLKMSFPTTYENLISIGIKEDYTLGFPDEIGFRAGMAIPFPFFNIERNERRPLTLVPFQIMEGTFIDYMKVSPNEALIQIDKLKKTIQDCNGQFVSIFHNSSFTDQGVYKGWIAIYKELFKN